MRNSLVRKYFTVCAMCVLASVLVLGVVLLLFSSQHLNEEKYRLLERNARSAAMITAASYRESGNGIINKSNITLAYGLLASTIDAEFFLTNVEGNLLYGVVPRGPLPKYAMDAILSGGIYTETGLLGGVFEQAQYVVAVPVESDGYVIGFLVAAASASGMSELMRGLIEMFVISSLVILVVALILIYFITVSLMRPLKEVLAATQGLSQGDFSMRVPVTGYDEIGQLSMAFNNMASSLASTESSRRSFVANVSHELKTPMTTIGGFVDGILDGTVPEEKRRDYLVIVSKEVKRLARLVRSMLDTARIEAGELEIKPQAFDLSETVRQTVFNFEQTLDDKQVQVEGLDAEKIMVWADKDLVHQVVYNLLENAVKFVEPQGTISVAYRLPEAKAESRMVTACVRNTGKGIPKEELPKLFERFYKSDKSRSLNKDGAGLGLHIVHSIVNYHKGEVLVRSVEGEYTEFEFSLPGASAIHNS
jgi:signal transduction histidine kinase